MADTGLPHQDRTEPRQEEELARARPDDGIIPIDEKIRKALSSPEAPKRRYVQIPAPTFAPQMEELFDQLWVKAARSLVMPADEDLVVNEQAEIRHQSIQSVVVTSWEQDEGSSTIALGLATRAALACRGEICLIDADAEHSGLTKMAGLEVKAGLRQILRDEATLENASFRVGDGNLHLVPIGNGAGGEGGIADNRLQAVLTELEERFRYVIFDAPALKHGIEGYRWGRLAVNSILVVRAGTARRQTVSHAVTSMRSHGLRVLGAIINRRVDLVPNWLYPYL